MKSGLFHCILPALAALAGGGVAACAGPTPVPMLTAPQTPAAQGTVVAEAAENGNTRLTVEVKHLAPPERVAPGAKVYVVWAQPQGSGPQNVGALRVGGDLTGRLVTITPFASFQVLVTAEEFPTATAPRGPTVLSAMVAQ